MNENFAILATYDHKSIFYFFGNLILYSEQRFGVKYVEKQFMKNKGNNFWQGFLIVRP